MTMSVRRLIIFCIFVTCSHITVHSRDFIKGSFSIGLDGLFGDFDSNQKLGDGILPFRILSNLSVLPPTHTVNLHPFGVFKVKPIFTV